MIQQLKKIATRYEELCELLKDENLFQDSTTIQKLSKEQASLFPAFELYKKNQKFALDLQGCEKIIQDSKDEELKQLALQEKETLLQHQEQLKEHAKTLLIPKDPRDEKNVILEIRAGTGGDEAGLFVADLLKLYTKFAELKGWKIEILEVHLATIGGYKFIALNIKGENVYSLLKFEAGTHRVQRIPRTESQGRIFCTLSCSRLLQ